MAILKLNKLSPYPYAGLVLLPGNNNVPDEYVEELMANPICASEFERGVFELVEGDIDAAKPVEVTDSEPPLLPEKAFDEMTVPEIEAAAAKRGISLEGAKDKAAKLAALKAGADPEAAAKAAAEKAEAEEKARLEALEAEEKAKQEAEEKNKAEAGK